jgi:phosphopantothenate synthetase
MLVIVLHEDAALPVDAAIGAVDQVVRAVMRVGEESKALQHDRAHVGDIVAVGVLEEEDVGLRGDDDAAIPELKAERIQCTFANSCCDRDPVFVVVVEDDERVLHLFKGSHIG